MTDRLAFSFLTFYCMSSSHSGNKNGSHPRIPVEARIKIFYRDSSLFINTIIYVSSFVNEQRVVLW